MVYYDCIMSNPEAIQWDELQIGVDRQAFTGMLRSVEGVFERMGGLDGTMAFRVGEEGYHKIWLSASRDRPVEIDLWESEAEVGTTLLGDRAYRFVRVHSLTECDVGLRYAAHDSLLFDLNDPDRSPFDVELDHHDEDYDFSAPLVRPMIRDLIATVNRILPGLSEADLIEEETDAAKPNLEEQAEITRLMEVMSTAGGSLGVLQYAAAERFGDSVPGDKHEIRLGDDTLVLEHYPPLGIDQPWELHMARLETRYLGGSVYTESAKLHEEGSKGSLKHTVSHEIYERDGGVELHVADRLRLPDDLHLPPVSGDRNTVIDAKEVFFNTDEVLPVRAAEIAIRMLRILKRGEIVSPDATDETVTSPLAPQ